MVTVLSYLALALFLGGSLYILGLMSYIVLSQGRANVKKLEPKDDGHPDLPKAA